MGKRLHISSFSNLAVSQGRKKPGISGRDFLHSHALGEKTDIYVFYMYDT